jgi:hypothetical protein
MSDVAIVCLTVVPATYALLIFAIMRLELRAPREPRRPRRVKVVYELPPHEPLPYEVLPPSVPPPSVAAQPRRAAVESRKPHPYPVTRPRTRHEITRRD